MPTAKKEAAIAELKERIAGSSNFFFTDYAGLTVEEITKLRGELRKDGSSYAVVKNTLFSIAAGKELADILEAHLKGPTGIVFAKEDPVAPAKALNTFAKETSKLKIKAGYVDGKLIDQKQVGQLAALPSKMELQAKLVGTLVAPLRGLLHALSDNPSKLVRVLNAYAEKKTAAAPPAAAAIAEAPVAEAPVAEAPVAEAPTAEVPTAETPTAESGA